MKSTELAFGFSIEKYQSLKSDRNNEEIANLIYLRFTERYINPFLENDKRHGFSMTAVCCLMIEAFQSFKEGLPHTRGRGVSEQIFNRFFTTSIHLSEFQQIDYYVNIRCGILHQAETYSGWRIWRAGKLLDVNNKTINADLFLDKLKDELNDYRNILKSESFESDIWKNAIKKLDSICKNSCHE